MTSPIDIPSPLGVWGTCYQSQVDELLNDHWLARKVNRERRWREYLLWLRTNLPELFSSTGKRFVDIGPGPGEAIEIARRLGHKGIGYDAESGEGGMGDNYLEYSKLMHFRQYLDILYVGRKLTHTDIDFIVMRGSIEQVFSDCMIGVPHHKHQKASELKWDTKKAAPEMLGFLTAIRQGLAPKGIVEIAANGSKNNSEYAGMLEDAANQVGLTVTVKSSLNHRLSLNG